MFWFQFGAPETPDAAESDCDLLRVLSALASLSSYFCTRV
jgi:hypothetical protein